MSRDQTPSPRPQRPRSKPRTGQLSGVQIMFAAILAIGLILAINFSTRITASRPLQELRQTVEVEIEQLESDQATLRADYDYARSEAFVEQWARQDGKMARPGEVLVIPIPAYTPAPPTPAPPLPEDLHTSPPTPEPWTLWWALFFDSPPP